MAPMLGTRLPSEAQVLHVHLKWNSATQPKTKKKTKVRCTVGSHTALIFVGGEGTSYGKSKAFAHFQNYSRFHFLVIRKMEPKMKKIRKHWPS